MISMHVDFIADSLAIYLLTPSVLENGSSDINRKIEYHGIDGLARRLYALEPGDNKSPVLLETGLPSYDTINQVDLKIKAWRRKDKKAVCVGNPSGKFTCTPLP